MFDSYMIVIDSYLIFILYVFASCLMFLRCLFAIYLIFI